MPRPAPFARLLLTLAVALPALAAEPAPVDAPAAPRPARRPGLLENLRPRDRAEKPDAIRLTLDEAVAKALASNLELRAAARIINEAEGARENAGLLANPELELRGGPGMRRSGSGIVEVTLSQRFPVTDRLRRQEQRADAELAAAREEVLIARRRLVGEVKADAIRLLAAREEIAVLRKRREIARELAGNARDLGARGEGDALEAGFLEIDAADLSETISRLEAERAALLAAFRVKLGLRPDADLDLTGGIPDGRDDYGLPDPNACPECRKITLLLAAADSSVEIARDEKWNDVTVGVFGQWERPNGTREPDVAYAGLRVIVPMPIWNDNAGGVRTARARRERLRDELAAEILRLDGEAQSARREIDNLITRLPDLRDRLLPAVRKQTDAVRAAVARGEAAPSLLFRALDKQRDLELREITLRRDVALALARLETALSAHPSLKEPVIAPELAD